MTKDDVRAAARRWELPLADKPAAACLASRIAYGVPVSAPRGSPAWSTPRPGSARPSRRPACRCANLRVRDLGGDTARVEIDAELVAEVAARPELLAAVAGFATGSRSTRAASGPAR